MHNCESCGEWYMEQQAIETGINVKEYPCVHLAYHSRLDCDMHDIYECPDVLIIKDKHGFGISIKNGGTAVSSIKYCPWCGIPIS
jgi:hypothetical protein